MDWAVDLDLGFFHFAVVAVSCADADPLHARCSRIIRLDARRPALARSSRPHQADWATDRSHDAHRAVALVASMPMALAMPVAVADAMTMAPMQMAVADQATMAEVAMTPVAMAIVHLRQAAVDRGRFTDEALRGDWSC